MQRGEADKISRSTAQEVADMLLPSLQQHNLRSGNLHAKRGKPNNNYGLKKLICDLKK